MRHIKKAIYLLILLSVAGGVFSALKGEDKRGKEGDSKGLPEKPFTRLFDRAIFGTIEEGFPFTSEMFETARHTVASLMKDPESAHFSDLFLTGDRKVAGNQYAAVLCGLVNAKSSFGGYTGNKPFVIVFATREVQVGDKASRRYNVLCAGAHHDPA